MNISLPEALRDFVEERVAAGGYDDAGEYVRALIREDRLRHSNSIVEAKVLEGLASGPPVEATDAYWKSVKAKVRHAGAGRKGER